MKKNVCWEILAYLDLSENIVVVAIKNFLKLIMI